MLPGRVLTFLGLSLLTLIFFRLLTPCQLSHQLLTSALFVIVLVVHPRVRPDFFNCEPIVTIISEELDDEVLELRAQRMSVDLRPVSVIIAVKKQFVEVLFLSCLFKGKDPLHDNEEDDCHREDVDLGAHVSLPFLDFWSHVRHCAPVRLQRVHILVTRETKVTNLQVQILIDQNVFKFQIAVNYALSVHVLNAIEQLAKEKSATVFAHGAHRLAKIEEKTFRHVLHHDVDQIVDKAARWLDNFTGVTVASHGNQVLLVHVPENRDFVMD